MKSFTSILAISTLFLGLLAPLSAAPDLKKSGLDDDPSLVYLEHYTSMPIKFLLIEDTALYASKTGKNSRKLGTLASGSSVQLLAMNENAYRISGKGKYGLEIGLAGYNKENVLVEVKDGILTVEGKVEDKNIDYVQKGLAYRKFIKQFELASDVIIDEAEMVDGLLKIKLGFKKPKEVEGIKVEVK